MISAKGRLFGGNTYEMGREIQACSFCGLSPMLGWALGWPICILPTHVLGNRPCLGFCKRLQETHWLTELVFDGIVSLVCCWCSVGGELVFVHSLSWTPTLAKSGGPFLASHSCLLYHFISVHPRTHSTNLPFINHVLPRIWSGPL